MPSKRQARRQEEKAGKDTRRRKDAGKARKSLACLFVLSAGRQDKMRYYEITRQEGRYKVMIYKILFSFLFPVFTGYTESTQAVNEMLMFYSKRTHTTLNTVYSYKAGAGR